MEIKTWNLNCSLGTFKATVPCSLYSVLYENKAIAHPYFSDNSVSLEKLSHENCSFETTLNITEEQLNQKIVRLVFEGIDTIAELYINGEHCLTFDNMFMKWTIDARNYLRVGENTIEIKFLSPLAYIDAESKKKWLHHKPWVYIRKSFYTLGWDWAPGLPDMGIWKKVSFIATSNPILHDVDVHYKLNGDNAALSIMAEIEDNSKDSLLTGEIVGPDGKKWSLTFAQNSCKITLNNILRWWPNGYGEPNLYRLYLHLSVGNDIIADIEKDIGFRDIVVCMEADDNGHEFAFQVNGIKIFARGANYIPEDGIQAWISNKKTQQLLEDCVRSNFNMVRVWGGGLYASDYFYSECDKKGLLVWQDCMFACNVVYLTKNRLKSIETELRQNLKRIAGHPSLALLCGNNEVESVLEEIYEAKIFFGSEGNKYDYLELFEHLIPDLCEEYMPDVFYWPSSPCAGGGFYRTNDENIGDTHYWKMWHQAEDWEETIKHSFRFLSEFGWCAYPNMETIKSFAKADDMNPTSYIMDIHQKSKNNYGLGRLLYYLSKKFDLPKTMEDYVYVSQYLQAEALYEVAVAMRRKRGHCMGTLFWQLNDCWPCISWSTIDYYGRWKAAQYKMKECYAPLILSIHSNQDSVYAFTISNEKREQFQGVLKCLVIKNDFSILKEVGISVEVEGFQSKEVFNVDLNTIPSLDEKNCIIVGCLYDNHGNCLTMADKIVTVPKKFEFKNPKLKFTLFKRDDKYILNVSATNFAKHVELQSKKEIFFEKNYFDIVNSQGIDVELHGKDVNLNCLRYISARSMYDLKNNKEKN